MKKSSFFKSLPFKLLVGVVIGILAGLALNANDGTGLTNAILNIVVTLKYVLRSADHHWIYRTVHYKDGK